MKLASMPQGDTIRMSPHLRADAPAFHPSYEYVNIAIFNDGVPSMTLPTEADRFAILHNIPDEAIDESFPPTAQDAAELEAVEIFVEMMAHLALLEEQEERARNEFAHIKKRWEARRATGLVGKPRPAKNLVAPVMHDTMKKSATQTGTTIIPYSQAHRFMAEAEKLRTREMTRGRVEPRRMVSTAKQQQLRRPIQQPRK